MAGLFEKEKKGFECIEQQDGSEVCKRLIKNKDGKIDYTGEELQISADPKNNCKPYKKGTMRVMDSEIENFDKIAERVSRGCKRNVAQNPGLSKG